MDKGRASFGQRVHDSYLWRMWDRVSKRWWPVSFIRWWCPLVKWGERRGRDEPRKPVEERACATDILSSRCLLAVQRLMLTEQFIQNLKLEELSELEIIIWDWWWRDVFISTAQYNFSVRQVNRKELLQFCIYLQVTSLQFYIFLKTYGSMRILKIRVY